MVCCSVGIENQRDLRIFGERVSGDSSQIAAGVFGVLATYPILRYFMNKVYEVMTHFNFDLTKNQEAVQIFISIQEVGSKLWRAALLTSFVFYVVILAPILEEVIFRGKFNTWMKNKMEEWGYDIKNQLLHKAFYWAVCGTVFGAFHLSPTQGLTNVPIFIATSLMGSCFSSLKDEEIGDITAPTVAHMLHNGIVTVQVLSKI